MHRQSATEIIVVALYAASEFTVRAVILAAIVLFLVVATHRSNDERSGPVGDTVQREGAGHVANGGSPYGSEQEPIRGEFERQP